MKLILDTSTFIKGTLERDPISAQVIQQAILYHQTLLTEEMAKELNVAIYQVAVRKGRNPIPALRIASVYLLRSNVIQTKSEYPWCADPDDAMFVECAIDGKADVVVSNDRSLTTIKEYVTDEYAKSMIRPIQFLTPEQFIQAFF
jgi:putative PIN family toxin of toxin-antitoxin system